MIIKDYTKISPALSLLGGTILLINGLVGSQISSYELYNYYIIFRYINAGVTCAWAGLAIYGAVLSFKGRASGKTLMIIAAIGGIIGTFIPIYRQFIPYEYGGGGYTRIVKLNGSAMFVDLVFILIAGILGYTLTERKASTE
ncbi:MAG: hypothetical protein ACFFA8_03250 [Promethearchaeota archaeon]